MPTSFKQCTPSVKKLFFMLLGLLPFAVFSQTPQIDAAEKALDFAKRDSTNTPQYATALREVWQAYRTFLMSERDSVQGKVELRLVTHDSAFRVSMDSLGLKAKQRGTALFLNKRFEALRRRNRQKTLQFALATA